MRKERLVTFTDAVLAIIMTILVLELPKPENATIEMIWNLKESFFAYMLSFFWLGALWFGMQEIWEKVDRISNKVIWWNIVLLFFASLIPYTTSLVSTYFDNGVMQGFYGLVVVLLTIINIIMHKVIDKPNSENKQLLQMTKTFRRNLFCDVIIKIIGLVIAVTIYPPAMMISVIVAASFTIITGVVGTIKQKKTK